MPASRTLPTHLHSFPASKSVKLKADGDVDLFAVNALSSNGFLGQPLLHLRSGEGLVNIPQNVIY